NLTAKQRTQLAVYASLLKEADLDRITSDAQTALNEDRNFYDVRESFQQKLPPAVKEYADAASAFVDRVSQLADSEPGTVTSADFAAAGAKARDTSFKLWQVAVRELDGLLETRVASYWQTRLRSLIFAALSLVFSAVVTTLIVRRLNRALDGILRRLGGSCQSVKAVAAQSAGTRQTIAEGATEPAASLEDYGDSM